MKPLLICLLLCAAGAAQAQYPDWPIRQVVPFTPGTGIDAVAMTPMRWGTVVREARISAD